LKKRIYLSFCLLLGIPSKSPFFGRWNFETNFPLALCMLRMLNKLTLVRLCKEPFLVKSRFCTYSNFRNTCSFKIGCSSSKFLSVFQIFLLGQPQFQDFWNYLSNNGLLQHNICSFIANISSILFSTPIMLVTITYEFEKYVCVSKIFLFS